MGKERAKSRPTSMPRGRQVGRRMPAGAAAEGPVESGSRCSFGGTDKTVTTVSPVPEPCPCDPAKDGPAVSGSRSRSSQCSRFRHPAVLFCPDAPRVVCAAVDQEWAARVAVSQSATVQDDGEAGAACHGRVYRVADWYTQRRSGLPEPLQPNDVRTLECLIAPDPGGPPLHIGQRVRVSIQAPPR